MLNKADMAEDHAAITLLRNGHERVVLGSAKTGEGLEGLRDLVLEAVRGEQRPLTLSVPAGDGKALSFLERFADVIDRRFEDGRAILDVLIAPRALEHLHNIARDIRHDPLRKSG